MDKYPKSGEWVLCKVIDRSSWEMRRFSYADEGGGDYDDRYPSYTDYWNGIKHADAIEAWYRPDELIQQVDHLRNQIRQCGQERTQLGNEVLDLRAEGGGTMDSCEKLIASLEDQLFDARQRAEQAEASLAEAEAKYMPIHEFINGAIDAYEEIMGQRTDVSPDHYQAGREIVESIANEWVAERRRVQQAEAERDYLAWTICSDCSICPLDPDTCESPCVGSEDCKNAIINHARTQAGKEPS